MCLEKKFTYNVKEPGTLLFSELLPELSGMVGERAEDKEAFILYLQITEKIKELLLLFQLAISQYLLRRPVYLIKRHISTITSFLL